MPPSLASVRLHPRPWSEPNVPYYVSQNEPNDDGFSGYSGRNCFDHDGVPYWRTPKGRIYNPLVIARYAMRMLTLAQGIRDCEAARKACSVLPALLASGRATGAWGQGPSPETMSSRAPSSIVQGAVISALTRFSVSDGSPELQGLIDRAVDRLIRPVEQGGTLSLLAEGPFLEEAPGTSLLHILNGCLYGLFGLYDAADGLSHRGADRKSVV